MTTASVLRAVAVSLVGLLVAACSAGSPASDPGPGPQSSTPSDPAGPAEIACGDDIGDGSAPDGTYTVVGDAVGLPATDQPALQAVPVGSDPGAPDALPAGDWWFAKWGLLVAGGHRAELSVAPDAADRLRIGWGSAAPPAPTVVAECASPGDWLAFAGGYWVREPGCYTVGVRVDDRSVVPVEIGVGAPCPGQAPPPGT